jgi:alpha-ribazole phosphatase
MEKTVFMFRHAEPQFPDCCKGKEMDCDLLDTGEETTARNVDYVMRRVSGQLRSTFVVTSPLKRARRFGEIWVDKTGLADTHLVEPGFTDIDVGDWEGKLWSQIEDQYPDLYTLLVQDGRKLVLPGGEAVAEYESKLLDTWRRLIQLRCAYLVLVGHSATNVPIIAHVDGNPVLNFKTQKEGCFNEIVIDAAGYSRVITRNRLITAQNVATV